MSVLSIMHFPGSLVDILLWLGLLALALLLLRVAGSVLIFVGFWLWYVVRGRLKEFNYKILNDPDFLSFDKDTGNSIGDVQIEV